MANARKKNDPIAAEKICNRLKLALGIMQSLDYYQDEKALYRPTAKSCGCKDFEYRLAKNRQYQGMCKHQIALVLEQRVNSLSYEQETFLGTLEAAGETSLGFPGRIWLS